MYLIMDALSFLVFAAESFISAFLQTQPIILETIGSTLIIDSLLLPIFGRSAPLPDCLVGGDQNVYVVEVAPGLQTIHLKEEEAHKLVVHLVHLGKPHGYALELDPA